MTSCIAPRWPGVYTRCPNQAAAGSLFCRRHEQAPAAQRGGWLSAERRRRKLAAGDLDITNITPPSEGGRGRAGPRRSLWVGAQPPFDRDLPEFDVLVLCARELQPDQVAFHGRLMRCPLPDSVLTTQELHQALLTAKAIAEALIARRRVLVTCAAGINRSPLVASLALARVTRMSADELVRVMRSRRPRALYNPHFVEILQRFVNTGR
jgi:hypothetical protein